MHSKIFHSQLTRRPFPRVPAMVESIPAGILQLSDPVTFIPIPAGNPRIPTVCIPVHTSDHMVVVAYCKILSGISFYLTQ